MSAPLILSDANVQWLQQLPGSAAADDFEVTYSFPHKLNHSRELSKQIVSRSGNDEHLLWHIQIYNADGEKVLEAPLARKVYVQKELRAVRENGPVAYNALFRVKESYRRQGLADSLYAAERRLYKKWGLREIHIDARDDGLVVWMKKFGFRPRFPEVLKQDYVTWARRQHEDGAPPATPADYREAFLRSRDAIELYCVME